MKLNVSWDKSWKNSKFKKLYSKHRIQELSVFGNKQIKRVTGFIHLSILVSKKNCIDEEIKICITAVYFIIYILLARQNIFKSKTVSRAFRVRIYKTILRPIVIHESEPWILTTRERKQGISKESWGKYVGQLWRMECRG